MLSQIIWWSAMVLEAVLLARGFRTKLASHLPLFYGYIAFVALQDIARVVSYHWISQLYGPVYWVTEFAGLAAGSLVIFEIYRVSLVTYPGAARMARNALAVVFLIAVAKGLADAPTAEGWKVATAATEVERALRTVQAAAILALVALVLIYSIPVGRNLRGLMLGYGLFIGQRVICLTFLPPQGHHFWFYAYSAAYVVTLAVWLGHLWSYAPVASKAEPPGQEYQAISEATQRRFRAARGSVRKAVRG